MKIYSTIAILIAIGLAGFSQAASIDIGDHSFETSAGVTGPGGWSNDLTPEWEKTAGPLSEEAFEEYIVGFAADGNNHLGVNVGFSVWQDLTETFAPNTIYTLTISAGNRDPNQTRIGNLTTYSLHDTSGTSYASGSFDAFANVSIGQFADAPPVVLNTALTPAAVGQTIRVQLDALGSARSHFDNIRLDAIAVPEPASAAYLFTILAVAIGFVRRRR